jgi:hypothetical protein
MPICLVVVDWLSVYSAEELSLAAHKQLGVAAETEYPPPPFPIPFTQMSFGEAVTRRKTRYWSQSAVLKLHV